MSTANPIIIHPSFTLKKLIDRSGKTQQEIALRLDMSEKHLSEILNSKKNITPETALKLEQVFGGKASFWINLQAKYDEALARQTMEVNIKSQVSFLERFKVCYIDLSKLGYVPLTRNKEERVQALLSFFEVTSLINVAPISQVAFRKSSKHVISDESVASWLRVGELMAKKIEVKNYDSSKIDYIIEKIREFTNDVNTFSSNLIELGKECGIKFIFVPRFSHAPINGATRWIDGTPIIQLSDMGKKFDRVIFTLFHELGHVALHPAESFLDESVGMDDATKKEVEADNFAQQKLIPSSFNFRDKLTSMIQSESVVINYSKELGIDSSILVGRLQREVGNYSLHHKLIKQVAIL